ncbi:MAG TPA: gamma-glutamyltransferase [Candidatus Competibacteraceae bacterium]|nr:gamma-glutamyltransferase [Candidatus Competibacteraceae bacterium]
MRSSWLRHAALAALAFALVSVGAVPAAPLFSDRDILHPVYARHGMVASQEQLATRVGVEILKQGGNAVDAAVAVGFALAVTLPQAGNLGGGGFMVLRKADGTAVAIDFREMAPSRASRDMYLDEQGDVDSKRSQFSHLAVGVPGTVAGLALAAGKYGTMPLDSLIAPAIELAEKGFPVSQALTDSLENARKTLEPWPATQAIFFKSDGSPWQPGETLVQQDLGRSLRLIAEQGPKAFYEGEIAALIAAEMERHGGLITQEDLKNYRALEREPVQGQYRGYRILSMPPPSSGGVHIVQILNILEEFPLKEMGAGSAAAIHHMAEAMKRAYADRSEYLGDPDFVKVPVKALTSKDYARALAEQIKPDRASVSAEIRPGDLGPYESDNTTHYSVVDQNGNAVAVTYTLNFSYGSGIVAAGTGILLNNEMDDFSAKPGVPNAYGLIGGEANAIAPAKRPLSSMSPTIVAGEDGWLLVTGSPGGSRIITTTVQILLNLLEHGMNIAEATAFPRIHHQWLPDELRVEEGLSPDTLGLLREMGHSVVAKPTMGSTQSILRTPDGLFGATDPRSREGAALGY